MLAAFEDLLKGTMGLDAASVGSSTVARAVKTRMAVWSIVDPGAYLARVRASETELQELVEAVVIPETWFFRDREAFVALARLARDEWLPAHSDGVLRLLSLPCATGEEPYSMAMALLEAGFPDSRFEIDAVDISARALARAELAVYGRNSFRGGPLEFRDRYFAPAGKGYRLAREVQGRVHFKRGNLFNPGLFPATEVYDVVFSRNLLIYFDSPTQERAIGLIGRLLTAEGLLFVGPSEASLLLDRDFDSVRLPHAFAFRRPGGSQRRPAAARTPAVGTTPKARRARSLVARPRPETQSTSQSAQKLSMAEIHRLADQGHLAEAARHCEQYLRQNAPPPDALHLLGLIREAAGNLDQAAEYYRKAIYLDPNHHQALVHLALLLEKQGDRAAAQVLNDRVRRLDRRAGAHHA